MIEHFTLAEFLQSEAAKARGIDNFPTWEQVSNLRRLAAVMERVRFELGNNAIRITSGFRNPAVNAAVGGATTSAHLEGLACDFVAPGHGDPRQVCRTLEPHLRSLGIDQLIWEFGSWVHLGLSAGIPRYQAFTIDNSGTRPGFA